MSDLERQLRDGLRSAAAKVATPTGGTGAVLERVAHRRRRRRRRQLLVTSGLATVVTVALLAAALGHGGPLRVRVSGSSPAADDASRDTVGARPTEPTVAPSVPASNPAVTPVGSPATTSTRYRVGWDHLVGVIDPAWTLTSATAWSTLRSAGWPTPYLRTSTWASGLAGPNGHYIVVQSEIDPASLPSDGTVVTTRALPSSSTVAGGATASSVPTPRTLTVSERGGIVTVSWTEQVAGRGVWTMSARGWNVDASVVEDAVRTASWDDTAERWVLTGLPASWSLQSWPNSGDPREVVLTYTRTSDGATLRVAMADAPGRFGADLVSLASLATDDRTAIDVNGRVGYAARATAAAGWQLAWPETDRIVARVDGPVGMAFDDVIRLLDPVSPSALTIAIGS